jgi:hypothetical protein
MVSIYCAAKGLVDAVSYNTQKYRIREHLSRRSNSSETQEATDDVISLTNSVRAQMAKLQSAVPELINRIEDQVRGKRRS